MNKTFKKINSILMAFLAVMPLSGCSGFETAKSKPIKIEPFEVVTIIQNEQILSKEPEFSPETEIFQEEEYVYSNTFEENRDSVDKAVERIAGTYGVMGCSVAAFEKDRIVYTYSYGTARRNGLVKNGEKWTYTNEKTPACDDTKYRVASISKLVTTVLAMQLVDEGKLSIEEDIAKIINPALQNPYHPEVPTTIEMLMAHTSGIVDGRGWEYASAHIPFPSLDKVIERGIFSGYRPGEKYCYSNIGMGLVSGAVEQASGKRFYDYARDALFAPMGIDAAYMTDYIEDRGNIAELRTADPISWGKMESYYTKNIPLGQMYLLGQGELYISAPDLAKIAMILAGDGTFDGKRYLTQESIDNIHTKRSYDPETNVIRGLTVQITSDIVEGVTLYGHQGNAYGAISCVFYDPETECGVVFLSNGANPEREWNYIYSVNDAIINELWKFF